MQNSTKIAEKSRFLLKFQQKYEKSFIKICEDFELRAVQRCDNLVDLEKRCKMSIWTQKSALIQLRTSLLKFDDLAENFERSSVSNFSTKLRTASTMYALKVCELSAMSALVGAPVKVRRIARARAQSGPSSVVGTSPAPQGFHGRSGEKVSG